MVYCDATPVVAFRRPGGRAVVDAHALMLCVISSACVLCTCSSGCLEGASEGEADTPCDAADFVRRLGSGVRCSFSTNNANRVIGTSAMKEVATDVGGPVISILLLIAHNFACMRLWLLERLCVYNETEQPRIVDGCDPKDYLASLLEVVYIFCCKGCLLAVTHEEGMNEFEASETAFVFSATVLSLSVFLYSTAHLTRIFRLRRQRMLEIEQKLINLRAYLSSRQLSSQVTAQRDHGGVPQRTTLSCPAMFGSCAHVWSIFSSTTG